MPEHLKKTKDKTNTYENRNEDGMTSLQLKADSFFIYLSLSTDGYKLSAGKYNLADDIITLEWDSIINYKAIEDTSIYKKFYARLKPSLFKIDNVSYILNEENDKLKKEDALRSRTLELFFSPKDVYDNPYRIPEVKQWIPDRVNNRYTIITKDDRQFVYKFDSIWGYRVIFPPNGSYGTLKRLYGFNYPHPVGQIDGIVIYHENNGYGSGYTNFFSKDAYSDSHVLNKKNLKKCFSDNPKFLELIEKNKDWRNVEYINGHLKWKVVDLYKQSLQK